MLWLVAITGAKEAYTAGVGIADGYAKRGGLSKETANQRRSTADSECIGKKLVTASTKCSGGVGVRIKS